MYRCCECICLNLYLRSKYTTADRLTLNLKPIHLWRLLLILTTIGTSTLASSQEILIPYKKGQKWGLADTAGNIKLEPQFETMPLYLTKNNSLYLVKQDGLFGIFDFKKSSYVFPCEFNRIEMVHPFFFLCTKEQEGNSSTAERTQELFTSNGQALSRYRGQLYVNTFYLGQLRLPKHLALLEVAQSDTSLKLQLYNLNTGQFVQTLYEGHTFCETDHAENGFFITLKQGETKLAKYRLTYNPTTEQLETNAKSEDNLENIKDTLAVIKSMLQDLNGRKKGTYSKRKGSESGTPDPKGYWRGGYYFPHLQRSTLFYHFPSKRYNIDNTKIFQSYQLPSRTYSALTIHYTFDCTDNQVEISKQQIQNWPRNTVDTLDVPIRYDKLKHSRKVRYSYQLTHADYGSQYEYKSQTRKSEHFAIFKQRNQIGILTELGPVEGNFDAVKGIGGYNERLPSFLVKRDSNVGIIDAKSQWLIEPIYDTIEIIYDRGSSSPNTPVRYYFATKNSRVYVYDQNYRLIDPDGFDSVTPNESYDNNFLQLKQDGKYGFYNSGSYVKPTFEYRINGVVKFQGYPVFPQYNEENEFLGYVNAKGVRFYN
jgi:hypothetical protein